WRYIRYADGSEELYNHDVDPNEWTNRADDPNYGEIKTEFAGHIPTVNAPELPKSNNNRGANQRKAIPTKKAKSK
ncbi:MAG: iduronate-2-sulfatase, partial [Planctomycetales bacterium]|nr:iduronate-2-sulfatase [Planctomycetales bacterium]